MIELTFPWYLNIFFCATLCRRGNTSYYRSRAAERFFLHECDLYWSDWSPVVTICTTSVTFNNSLFRPHSVFMCFVWISEQKAIISLYSINWLVCVTETESVYCAVRTVLIYNSGYFLYPKVWFLYFWINLLHFMVISNIRSTNYLSHVTSTK